MIFKNFYTHFKKKYIKEDFTKTIVKIKEILQ